MGRGLGRAVRTPIRFPGDRSDLPHVRSQVVSEGAVLLTREDEQSPTSYLVTELPTGLGIHERAAASSSAIVSYGERFLLTADGCSCGRPFCPHFDLALQARRLGLTIGRGQSSPVASSPLVPAPLAERVFAVANGSVWAWGKLGKSPETVLVTMPIAVLKRRDVVAVAPLADELVALDRDGRVTVWKPCTAPSATRSLNIENMYLLQHLADLPPITQIAAGSSHALALDREGRVWAWGSNQYGQCSVGQSPWTNTLTRPQRVPGLEGVVQIAAGSRSSYALRDDGVVLAWGCNEDGQIGIATPPILAESTVVVVPTAVETSDPTPPTYRTVLRDVERLFVGPKTVIARKKDGTFVGWGDNSAGQLLIRQPRSRSRAEPLKLPDVSSISVGLSHVLALRADGRVLAWGSNAFGQLGTKPSRSGRLTPVVVPDVTGAVAVAAGERTSFALLADGSVVVWGCTEGGLRGNGHGAKVSPPTVVPGLRLPVAPEARSDR